MATMKLRLLVLAAVAAVTVGHAQAQGRPDLVAQSMADPGRKYVPYQMLVQFRAGADSAAQDVALRQVGARAQERLLAAAQRRDGRGDLHLVNLPPGMAVATALRFLEQTADVDFVEPNWIYEHQANSTDPLYTNGSLWGMYGSTSNPANQWGSHAGAASGPNNCSGVWVGVIDEGYMYTHEDLALNAGTNPGEIAGNGVDDDGNGLVDDVYGWDFDGNNNTVFDGADDDHGTHVAGTIGGVGNNAKGVSGVCWTVKLISAKFLGKRGGTTANAIKSVDYMTNLKTRHSLNLVATNNSWGGGGFSQGLQDAIERANTAGILFIAAAGNSGVNNDSSPHYPSSYDNANIISVASITSTGAMSSFSNYGANSVDICAPGSSITSTLPKRQGKNVVSAYGSYSGTSMATPHVAGAAALYKARNSGASAAQIKSAILNSATATDSCGGRTVTGGRLNVSLF
jgi:subtilisin family serine protease